MFAYKTTGLSTAARHFGVLTRPSRILPGVVRLRPGTLGFSDALARLLRQGEDLLFRLILSLPPVRMEHITGL